MSMMDMKTPTRHIMLYTPVPITIPFITRFSRDVETIDNTLPMNFRMFLLTFFGALSSFIVISYTTPLFLVAMIPIAFLYYLIQFSSLTNDRIET
ncbi:ABCC8-like protein [Mya arenaria]|uniref:ABCC8-like protein n=1 Tax=Mya arenaria TaxID=6604 RepID=A0ABY7EBS2_MYAAR|nr:ABCC8-like protein [Mya arenaria]